MTIQTRKDDTKITVTKVNLCPKHLVLTLMVLLNAALPAQ